MRISIRHLSKSVHGTPYAGRPTVKDMRINHGRLDILMPQQFLDRSDVVTAFKQMGGEGMCGRSPALSDRPSSPPYAPPSAQATHRRDAVPPRRSWRCAISFPVGRPIAGAIPWERWGICDRGHWASEHGSIRRPDPFHELP